MSDITTVWLGTHGDWQMAGADLLQGNDLYTNVVNSLFSDRLAEASDVLPDTSGDRRGWWGDEGEEYPLGSRLWLLSRSKLTQKVANAAIDYANEALQWMLNDDVVAAINITTAITLPNMLGMQVALSQENGTTHTFKFAWAWNQLAA